MDKFLRTDVTPILCLAQNDTRPRQVLFDFFRAGLLTAIRALPSSNAREAISAFFFLFTDIAFHCTSYVWKSYISAFLFFSYCRTKIPALVLEDIVTTFFSNVLSLYAGAC